MNIAGLIPLLQAHPQYRRIRDALARAVAEAGSDPKSKIQNLKSDDLLDAAKPLLLAALAADPEIPARRILIITARPERARELAAALDLYAPAEQASGASRPPTSSPTNASPPTPPSPPPAWKSSPRSPTMTAIQNPKSKIQN